MLIDTDYIGREQTLVKHFILKGYLERFSRIIGNAGWRTINYVDCFSGPWESTTDDYRDTSFGIALRVLAETRDYLAARGKPVLFRCFFLESDPERYVKLAGYVDSFPGIVSEHANKKLDGAVDDVVEFASAAPGAFTFTFIDPTGWTGFALERIRPLLRIKPGEVLINFMTDYIRRFIDLDNDESRRSFDELLGEGVTGVFESLQGQSREDELLRRYIRNVRRTGSFSWVGTAIVFKPDIEKTNFHLIYGTRGTRGIEKFKEVERRAMKFTEEVRAAAKTRRAQSLHGNQQSFLSPAELYPSKRMEELRLHYLNRSRESVRKRLKQRGSVLYGDLWKFAVAAPLVWKSDVDKWILEWRDAGDVEIHGSLASQKKPKEENTVKWLR